MRPSTQVTLPERVSIGHLHAYGLSLREIARRLDRSPRTIAREVRRNLCPWSSSYDGWTAHPEVGRGEHGHGQGDSEHGREGQEEHKEGDSD